MGKVISLKIVILFFSVSFTVLCCFPEACPEKFPRGDFDIYSNRYCDETLDNGTISVGEDSIVINYLNDVGEEIEITYKIVEEYFN